MKVTGGHKGYNLLGDGKISNGVNVKKWDQIGRGKSDTFSLCISVLD